MLSTSRSIKMRLLAKVMFSLGMIIVLALPLSLGCAPAPPEEEPMDRVSLRLAWVPNPERVFTIVGIEKGFFADEGLDVELGEGVSGMSNAQLVGAGIDEFGEDGITDLIEAVQAGMTVKAVATVEQRSPMGIVLRAEAGVTHPKDLEGKSLAGGPGSSTLAVLPAVMKAVGADYSKVTVRIVDWGAIHEMLLLGKVDGILEYWVHAAPQMEKEGLEVTVIKYADFGVNTYGTGTFASEQLIEENPDLVRRFVRAQLKTWQYAIDHPEEAVDAYCKFYPDFLGDEEMVLKSFRNFLEGLHTENTVDKPLGWMAKEDWEQTQDLMFEYLDLTEKLPVETYYTNQFIP